MMSSRKFRLLYLLTGNLLFASCIGVIWRVQRPDWPIEKLLVVTAATYVAALLWAAMLIDRTASVSWLYDAWAAAAIDLVGASIVGYLTYTAEGQWNARHDFAASALGLLLTHAALTLGEFNQNHSEMRRSIISVLGSLRDVAMMLEEAQNLGPSKTGLIVRHANRRLSHFTRDGFLLELPYQDFLQYVEELVKESRRVFGTSVIRRPMDLASDKQARRYLEVLRQAPCRRLVRVTVLHDTQILQIVKDALDSLEPHWGPPVLIQDLPEVQWWVTVGNDLKYSSTMTPLIQTGAARMLLWATHDNERLVKSGTRVEDYAVFDDEVVLRFWENRQIKKGLLSLLWHCKDRTTSPISRYTALRLDEIDGVLAGPTPGHKLEDLKLYLSFYELLQRMEDKPRLDVSGVAAQHFTNPIDVPVDAVYSKVVELVNAGTLQFKSAYMQLFS